MLLSDPSPPFIVSPHPLKGRAVTATRQLPASAPLLLTPPCALYTLQRDYRREVCARCFAYDRGTDWKTRVELPREGKQKQPPSLGLVFCTEACRDEWIIHQGPLGLKAWRLAWEIGSRPAAAASSSSTTTTTTTTKPPPVVTNREADDRDRTADGRANVPPSETLPARRPTAAEIDAAWARAEDGLGRRVREVRLREREDNAPEPTKAERKLLQRAKDAKPVSIEAAWAIVSGTLTHYRTHAGSGSVDEVDQWEDVLQLKHHEQPYASHEEMDDYINTYLCLLALVPAALLPSLTPGVIQTLQNAAAHNSFSIRPALASGAYNAEYLGWGLWTTGSIWNHSCAPNVAKERVGDRWVFVVDPAARAGAGVAAGEELCISYLGGDEKELGVAERRKRLRDAWGFDCQCDKCRAEAAP